MNEKINKLWDQAWDDNTPLSIIKEKFAELIVQECIEQIVTGPNGPAHYAVEAAVRVKKHFGVE